MNTQVLVNNCVAVYELHEEKSNQVNMIKNETGFRRRSRFKRKQNG